MTQLYAIQYTADIGFEGRISRTNMPYTTDTGNALYSNPPVRFGDPVAIDSSTGRLRPIGAGDTTAAIYGVIIEEYPSQSWTFPNPAINGNVPSTTNTLTVLTSGYVIVQLNGSTQPAKNGKVWVRTVSGSDTVVGGYSAAQDSTNNFEWVGARFTGKADASGNAEIFFIQNALT